MRVVLAPQGEGNTWSWIGSWNVHHEASYGDQVVPFPPPSLVLSTMAVPYTKLLSLSLTSTIQDFSVQLGHDEECPIGLVVKVPQLVRRGWAVHWEGYDFRSVCVAASLNVKYEPIEVSLDVNIMLDVRKKKFSETV